MNTSSKHIHIMLQVSTSHISNILGETLPKSASLLLSNIGQATHLWVLGSPGGLEKHGFIVTNLPLLPHFIHIILQISDTIPGQHYLASVVLSTCLSRLLEFILATAPIAAIRMFIKMIIQDSFGLIAVLSSGTLLSERAIYPKCFPIHVVSILIIVTLCAVSKDIISSSLLF
jgi:hypothetical protein